MSQKGVEQGKAGAALGGLAWALLANMGFQNVTPVQTSCCPSTVLFDLNKFRLWQGQLTWYPPNVIAIKRYAIFEVPTLQGIRLNEGPFQLYNYVIRWYVNVVK